MPFRIRVSLAILLSLLVLLLVGPLLVPVPELEDTSEAGELALEESSFLKAESVRLHYLEEGSGEPGFLLLHGYPSNATGWLPVLPEFALYGRTVAFDRPGFGLSDRPERGSWPRGENPYSPEQQLEQALALTSELDLEAPVWVASSSGALLALGAALEHPDQVTALVLVGAPVYSDGSPPAWLRPLLRTPQLSRVGPLLMRQLGAEPGMNLYASQWHDPEEIDEERVESFRLTFSVDDWDRGLWEVTRASRDWDLADELGRIELPVLVVSGAQDQIVPPEESERLARELPNATLALMEGCGHVPFEECPAQFTELVLGWLGDRTDTSSP